MGARRSCCYCLMMKRDEDDYEELPAWRYYIYPVAGAVGVLAIIALWTAFR